jgi:hypothetical protein
MSSSRIYRCLEAASCNVTARGQAVLKSSVIGLMAGALSGAALGGISVGFHDVKLRDDGIRNFENDDTNKSKYPEVCTTDKDKHMHCHRPGLSDASYSYGLNYAKEEIAKVWPWIFIGCTAGGAALGLFAGAVRGWNKTLPANDIESQNSNYRQLGK